MQARVTVCTFIAGVSLILCAPAGAGYDAPTYSFSGSFDLRIPANPGASKGWMDDAVIEVPMHLTITDLDVSVSITHTKAFDLTLAIESPSGTTVLLNESDPFTGHYNGPNYHSTIFDDEAVTPIEQGQPPFEGRFRPLAGYSLSAFDGEDAYGVWTFKVCDNFVADVGEFDSFGLTITTPEPATVAFLLVGVGLAGLSRRRKA